MAQVTRCKRKEVWMRVLPGAARLIKSQRRNKGFTQRNLADLCNRQHTTIYLLEKGELKNVRRDLAERLAKWLELPMEVLFEERDALGRIDLPSVQPGIRRSA